MISLKELIQINKLKILHLNLTIFNDLKKLKNLRKKDGETDVKIIIDKDNKIHKFQLKR